MTLAFLVLCSLLASQQGLNNDAVIKLTKAGLSEDLIISNINSQKGSYDLSADGLIALKAAGVSDRVVNSIVQKTSGSAASRDTVPTAAPFAVIEPSVSYQKGDQWVDFDAERADIKVPMSLLPGKVPDTEGRVNGKTSNLILSSGSLVRLSLPGMTGTDISDCKLIRFHVKGNAREFTFSAGGYMKVNGGSGKDSVAFESKKIAPHIYEVPLSSSLAPGEYGFLVGQVLKVFTFRLQQ
jgi:hypothetical protein